MSCSGPGQVLFTFVRHWSRRAQASDQKVAEHGRLVLVTEAVHALAQRGIAAMVNAVAHEIGLDQSGASRLVKSATEAGYLTMQASPIDGRQRQAMVTASGHALLEHAHDWQERVFDRLTQGWSEQQRRDFQHAMTDLIERSYALDACPTPTRHRHWNGGGGWCNGAEHGPSPTT
jgi:MarR family transcriptional regulator, organic hydroperoxide resistance regulator